MQSVSPESCWVKMNQPKGCPLWRGCMEVYDHNIMFLVSNIFWIKCAFDFRYGEETALPSGQHDIHETHGKL